MFRIARRSTDTWADWFKRNAKVAIRFYTRTKRRHIVDVVLQRIHAFGRRMAAQLEEGQKRTTQPATLFLADALAWKDRRWWRTAQFLGEIEDKENESGWRHARRGNIVVQWEDILIDVHGESLSDSDNFGKPGMFMFLKQAQRFANLRMSGYAKQ